MHISVLFSSVLMVLLVESTHQGALPEGDRATRAYAGGGSLGYGAGQGYGGSQGYRGSQGYGASQGYRGSQGSSGQGADSRYGFNIVDTSDKYGYEANYPGGRASFFLLGPNRGPGQQSGRSGYSQGQQGGSQQGSRSGYSQGQQGSQQGGSQQVGYQQGSYQQGGRGGW